MTFDAHQEKMSFQAEVKQLLNIVVHSLYSNKEIFLRELISNSSDAIDKLRFEAISDPALYESDSNLNIRIDFDKEARTLTVSDNGIGMSRDEVVANLGTIAKSGTREFLSRLSGDQKKDAHLIGQFGVGFYSAFIVADKVTVVSRRAGLSSEHGVTWESKGDGEYTVANVEKKSRGTDVILHLKEGELSETAKQLDKASRGYISKLAKQGSFQGKIGQILPLFQLANTSFAQVLLVGCGKTNSLSASCFRKILYTAIKALGNVSITNATCYLTELDVEQRSQAWKVKFIAETALDAQYCFDLFKSKKDPAVPLKELVIDLPNPSQLKACEQALQQAEAIASGIVLTKNLANTPSNICTPSFIADQAKELAKTHRGLSVKVLDEKAMQKLGMGALLGVSQGSAEEAKLICLEYKGGKKSQAPIAFIGKGVTFDTGGNSLKPADSMVGMKYDMCGAATVLGTLKAAAELKLPLNIVGIIGAVENMPGGTAYKPEDILTSMSGQTIEVISTDAEGRLVLADALTYCERYKPDVVIDIATLTGAVVIALGFHATGLVSNYQPLANALLKAGEESHDRAWQLPLWEEYKEQIKSPFADMANVGGRAAGTITAGAFLAKFADKFHWAHLDVAGTAAMMAGTSERMATGRPVPMLVQYLLDRLK